MAIDGWMQESELQWLGEQAVAHKLIIEIGSYKGRSTRALGDNTKGFVVAIDHWKGEDHLDLTAEQRTKLYDEFCANLADLIEQKKVIPLKLNHRGLTPNLDIRLDFRPDFVFIDGSHRLDDVRNDINIWHQELCSGGLISGHDSGYPDVAQAIRELIPNFKLVPDTSIWFAIKE